MNGKLALVLALIAGLGFLGTAAFLQYQQPELGLTWMAGLFSCG